MISCTTIGQSMIDKIMTRNKIYTTSPNYGKSVGVFGGSISSIPNSNYVKDQWRNLLAMNVTDYGALGFGFSKLQGSIQNEVNNCLPKDIYVLWASTNDLYNNRLCGTDSDYTVLDNYDDKKLTTQCGGINYCIKKLREINPDCKIYFISTFQSFKDKFGFDSTYVNGIGERVTDYIYYQRKCCERNNVKFLDLFHINIFNQSNYKNYFSDTIHPNETGYKLLSYYILTFISELSETTNVVTTIYNKNQILYKIKVCNKYIYIINSNHSIFKVLM